MEDQSKQRPSALGELALWVVASLGMTAVALSATGIARTLLEWSDQQWIGASVVVGVASLTWGSWASLLWTRSKVLKTLMIAVVVVPGMVMLIVGGWALLNVPDNRWIWRWGWLVVAMHGAGALAFGLYICSCGLIGTDTRTEPRGRRLLAGWTLFPAVVAVGLLAAVMGVSAWMPDVATGGDGFVEMLARWSIPSQALVLVTTVLPAGAAHLCHQLTLEGHR